MSKLSPPDPPEQPPTPPPDWANGSLGGATPDAPPGGNGGTTALNTTQADASAANGTLDGGVTAAVPLSGPSAAAPSPQAAVSDQELQQQQDMALAGSFFGLGPANYVEAPDDDGDSSEFRDAPKYSEVYPIPVMPSAPGSNPPAPQPDVATGQPEPFTGEWANPYTGQPSSDDWANPYAGLPSGAPYSENGTSPTVPAGAQAFPPRPGASGVSGGIPDAGYAPPPPEAADAGTVITPSYRQLDTGLSQLPPWVTSDMIKRLQDAQAAKVILLHQARISAGLDPITGGPAIPPQQIPAVDRIAFAIDDAIRSIFINAVIAAASALFGPEEEALSIAEGMTETGAGEAGSTEGASAAADMLKGLDYGGADPIEARLMMNTDFALRDINSTAFTTRQLEMLSETTTVGRYRTQFSNAYGTQLHLAVTNQVENDPWMWERGVLTWPTGVPGGSDFFDAETGHLYDLMAGSDTALQEHAYRFGANPWTPIFYPPPDPGPMGPFQ